MHYATTTNNNEAHRQGKSRQVNQEADIRGAPGRRDIELDLMRRGVRLEELA